MKKLMLAAAIVCAAVMSHGAAMAWTYWSDTSAGDTGNTAYLILGDAVAKWDSAAAVKAAAIDYGTVLKVVNDVSAEGYVESAALDSATKAYFVLLSSDESKYAVTEAADITAYVYDPAQGTRDPFEDIDNSMRSAYTEFSSVPEPTSGLLLLLGVAGLALRRRRA